MSQKRLSEAEITAKLDQHKIWLDSNYAQGEQLNLSNETIKKFNFSDRDLRFAIFSTMTLVECNFSNCILEKASFVHSTLAVCDFKDAKLLDCNFGYAYVRGCNFKDAKLITIRSFSRADVTSSKFPEEIDFDKLVDRTNVLIKKVRNITNICLLISGAIVLTIMLNKCRIIELPFGIHQTINLNSPVDIGFLFITLIISTLFLTNSTVNMKQAQFVLPSILQDGRQSYETIYPWFIPLWSAESFYLYLQNNNYQFTREISRIAITSLCASTIFSGLFFLTFQLIRIYLIPHIILWEIILITGIGWAVGFMISLKARKETFYTYVTFAIAISSVILMGNFTSAEYVVCYALSLAVAWFLDLGIGQTHTDNEIDLPVPIIKNNQALFDKFSKKYLVKFHITNALLTVTLCFLIAAKIIPSSTIFSPPDCTFQNEAISNHTTNKL